jgi:hypothetical protein
MIIEKIEIKDLIFPYVAKFSQTYFKGVNESFVQRHER